MSTKTMINDLTTGSVAGKLLRFSAPLVLANILQAFYTLVDMVVVGQFVGAAGLSAVGVGGQISSFMMWLGFGFSAAAQILVAQQVGSKDHAGISKTVGTCLSCLALLAIACSILGVVLAKPVLNLLNTPEEAWTQAVQYTIICSCGQLFVFGYNGFCCLLRGMGESKLPMVFVAVASIANLLLDLLFVAVFHMGAAGAALATIAAQALSCVLALVCLYRRKEQFGFDFKLRSFRIDPARCLELFKLGLPLMLQNVLLSVSMMYINANVNVYGVAVSAVDTIGNKLSTITSVFTMALSQACSAMMGQCFGARMFDRFKKTCYTVALFSGIIWIVVAAILLIFANQIFGIFTSDEAVLYYAPLYMRYMVINFFGMASMTPFYAVIESIGNAVFLFIISILDGIVARIGLSMLLGHFMGLNGYWLSNAIAPMATTIPAAIYFFSGAWKKRSLIFSADSASGAPPQSESE